MFLKLNLYVMLYILLIAIPFAKASGEENEIRLTLRDSIEIALEKNETVLKDARIARKSARLNLIGAYKVYRPQIGLDTSAERTGSESPPLSNNPLSTDQESNSSNVGNTYTNSLTFNWPLLTFTKGVLSVGWGWNLNMSNSIEANNFTNSLSYSMEWKQALSRGGRLQESASLRLARENFEMTKMDYEEAIDNLVFQVIVSYCQLIRAKHSIKEAKEQVELSKKLLKWAKAHLQAGEIARLDIMNVEVQLGSYEDILIQAINAEKEVRRTFLRLLGLEEDKEVSLDERIELVPIHLSEDECTKKALANRVEIKKGQRTLELAKLNVDMAGSGNKPVLSVKGNYNWSGTGEEFHQSMERLPQRSWAVSTGVTFPFFDSGTTKNDVKLAKENYQRVENSLKESRRDIVEEIRQAYQNLERDKKRIDLLLRNLEIAQKALEISQLKYKMGIISVRDVLDTQMVYSQVKRTVQDTEMACNIDKARLYKAMGEKVEQYVE